MEKIKHFWTKLISDLDKIPFIIWIILIIFLAITILLLMISIAISFGVKKGYIKLHHELEVEKHQLRKSSFLLTEKEKIALMQLSNFYFLKSILQTNFFIAKAFKRIALLFFLIAIIVLCIAIILYR